AGVTVSLAAGTAAGGHATGDTLTNIAHLIGSAFADSLTGDIGVNRLEGGVGADMLDGGGAEDMALYTRSATAITINLLTGVASGGEASGDTLVNIEHLSGSAFNDNLAGDTGDNNLAGDAGQ